MLRTVSSPASENQNLAAEIAENGNLTDIPTYRVANQEGAA